MKARRLAHRTLLLALVTSVGQVARAEGADACSVAYARGQEERLAGRLYNARTAFQACAAQACSAAIASDCGRWVKEVEADLPTIRLSVRDERGGAVRNLQVSVDGAWLALSALSAPIVLEAGPHELSFEAPGYQPLRLEKALRPSDREVPVIVTLRAPPTAARRVEAAPVPMASWMLAGAGAVALSGSIYFGVRANARYHELKDSCAPACEPSASDGMQSNAVLSDVALVGSVALFAASAVVYFTRTPKPASTALSIDSTPHGGRVRLRWVF